MPAGGSPQSGWRLAVKVSMDRAFAAGALVLASPPLMLVALAIRITMGRPVFFRQERPGYSGRPFRLLKFRTMTAACSPEDRLVSDGRRLTPLGRLLRSTSVDELPQLWNVLRGELSLVGPRPLLMHYLPLYSAEQARRHDVLPGITGWAQVNGRNAISWEEKFALDVWYVENWSLLVDLRILARTVWGVLRREGISREGHATTPECMGCEAPEPSLGNRRGGNRG